jgi:outer membrane biosynthesis protein TonB
VKLETEEDEGFFQRNMVALIVGAFALIGTGWLVFGKPLEKNAPARKPAEPQMVRLVLPPPPPPPPPKIQPPPPKDEKQTEQAAPDKAPEKPADKPKPVDKPPEGLGTSIRGPGTGMAGLGSYGNGMIGGTGKGPGGGSAASYYANQVQTKVAEALRSNPKTRSASINSLKFSVSVDGTGRITSINLAGSTGDPSLDAAIKNEVLIGLKLDEPPPKEMRMPVNLRLTARRPTN